MIDELQATKTFAAQLQAESAQYKSDAMRFESERNTAIDCAEDYKAIIAQMKAEYKAQIEQLRAELENSGAAYVAKCKTVTELKRLVSDAVNERDAIAAELATVKAERDVLSAHLDNVQQENAELRCELNMSYTADDPRITINGWQAETPLGQMIDGLGDEVEP